MLALEPLFEAQAPLPLRPDTSAFKAQKLTICTLKAVLGPQNCFTETDILFF